MLVKREKEGRKERKEGRKGGRKEGREKERKKERRKEKKWQVFVYCVPFQTLNSFFRMVVTGSICSTAVIKHLMDVLLAG